MSQAGQINSAAGPLPPSVATSYVTQNGTAVPLANVLLIDGFDSTENNNNGIISKGGVVGTGISNEVDIVITNRIRGSVTTADNTPTTLSTFALGAVPGVYNFDIQIAGYDTTDTAGCGYFISGSVRTTGAAAVLVGTPDKIVNEEVATVGCDANLVVSGNNAVVQITGISGKTVNWKCLSQYIFVS
jgi:hypothetical protein